MAKIRIRTELLFEAFPEARNLGNLPRKKKKEMKKKIAHILIKKLTLHAELMLAQELFHRTMEGVNESENC